MTGLRALYFYYLYRMGVLPKTREPNPKRVYFLFREDIRHMQDIAAVFQAFSEIFLIFPEIRGDFCLFQICF